MQTAKPFWNSLVFKLFFGLFIIIVPLVVVHIINSFYAVQVIKSQVAQSNKNMLNIYMDQIDQSLDGVGNYIFQLSEGNGDLLYLQENIASDYNEYLEAKLRLYQSIASQSNFYTTIDAIFIYSNVYKDMIYTQKFGDSYIERYTTVREMTRLFEEGPVHLSYGRWMVFEGEYQHYLLHVIKNGDVYVGAWVNMEKLIYPFKHIDFGESGRALITTSNNVPVTHQEFLQEEGIQLTDGPGMYTISGTNENFLVMRETSTKAAFNLIALIPETAVLEQLPYLQRISTFISLGAILFLLLFIFFMRKVFLQPINRIVVAMKKLRKGDFDIRLQKKRSSTEFEMMDESFNTMISEIRDLKINVYEEKLNLQRAELKHLQLQINPHFFLNSLNIIYNLATVKDFALIQEMSKCLANYFRFMFRSNSYFVSLDDEITHTKNYLKIQQLRFPETFSYHVDAPKELVDCKIPPLIIQTIAENSIKHAFNMDDQIEINIKVWIEEDPSYIGIEIQDTGEGFPDDVLSSLERDEPLTTDEGERIGIWNVKRRLSLLYGDKSRIQFLNVEGKGATVRMRIPNEKLF